MFSWLMKNLHSLLIAIKMLVFVAPPQFSAILLNHVEFVAIFDFGKTPFLKDIIFGASFIQRIHWITRRLGRSLHLTHCLLQFQNLHSQSYDLQMLVCFRFPIARRNWISVVGVCVSHEWLWGYFSLSICQRLLRDVNSDQKLEGRGSCFNCWNMSWTKESSVYAVESFISIPSFLLIIASKYKWTILSYWAIVIFFNGSDLCIHIHLMMRTKATKDKG